MTAKSCWNTSRGDKTPVELFLRFCIETKDFGFRLMNQPKLT
jgi:hypothetical protein